LISLRPPGETVLHWLRRAILIEAAYLAISYILIHAKFSLFESLLGGVLTAFVVERMIPGKKWCFSTSAWNAKVAEQELRMGENPNTSKNELDRVVRFSRGGRQN
jgi:hypothetical protein